MKLKEECIHGSREYPYDQYYMHNIRQAFQIPVHWHDELEIIFVEAGELQVKIGDQEYIGRAGDVFFVNERELHLMGAEDVGVQYYTVLFPLSFLSFQTMDELEMSFFSLLRNQQLVFPEYIADEELRKVVFSMLKRVTARNHYEDGQEIRQENYISQHLQTRMLLLEMLLLLYEGNVFEKGEVVRNSDMKRDMLVYIGEHFKERMTLGMLAKEFHLSEKYVSRYFVENFHIPFSNYVVHLRLSEARKLLETTELPVTDVAFQAGFSNVSYFIRAFKEMYGLSPLKYRKSERVL